MKTFKDMGLSPKTLDGLSDLNFTEPSPVQAEAIPFLMESKNDLIALAQTGTGKTAAFSLPIIDQLDVKKRGVQAMILCPTRELCMQISGDIERLSAHHKGIITAAVYGGARADLQIKNLKAGANIVVGTPGRVCDLIKRKALKLQDVRWLVLDEADEMLDMGFKQDLNTVLEQTPDKRQTLLFSATMSKVVRSIAKKYMKSPQEISVGGENSGAENVSHEFFVINVRDRFEATRRILDSLPDVYGILFCRTKRETQDVADRLKQADYDTECIHGDISQDARSKIMDRFKKKQVKLLVATDVAARGIDVNGLTHVINYSLPDQPKAYTHRSGRTGRAQKSGVSISLIGPRDKRNINNLERIIGKTFIEKEVPGGDDIINGQIDSFVGALEGEEFEQRKDKCSAGAIERLSKLRKDQLVNALVDLKFGKLLDDYRQAKDLKVKDKNKNKFLNEGNETTLEISAGKKDGFGIKDLFGIINSNSRLKGVDIGRINIGSKTTLFSVDNKFTDEFLKALGKIRFKGRNVSIFKRNVGASSNTKRLERKNKRGKFIGNRRVGRKGIKDRRGKR